MKVEEANTEAAAVAGLIEQAARPEVMDVAGVPVLVLPQGWQRVDYDKFLTGPLRDSHEAHLATVEALVRFIALRDKGATQVFTHRVQFVIQAVFNPPTKEGAGWGDDRATLEFQLDSCLKRWKERAGQWMTQAAFGDFLRERGVDIMHPDAGTILDLVENLETHSSVKGKWSRRTQDGSVTIQWEEDTQATMTVPPKFALRLPCFNQSDTMFEVECRLNFRAKDGVLHWQFLIDEFDAAIDAAWDVELSKLRDHADLPPDVRARIFAAA